MATRNICRLCLASTTVNHSLLEKKNFDMLEALTGIQVSRNDVSSVACTKCLVNLKLAFKIQQRILKSSEELRRNKEKFLTSVEPDTTNTILIINNSSSLHAEKCVICNAIILETDMGQHIQSHFSAEQHCDLCSKTYKDMVDYKQHWTKKHNSQLMHNCKECNLNFKYRSFFKIHMSNVHENVEESDKILEERAFTERMDELHAQALSDFFKQANSSTVFECDVCMKRFRTKKQLSAHNHLKKKCPICEAEITKSNFIKHVNNHKSGPQVCEICGSILSSLESLRGHMHHVHGTFSKNCPECGKLFKKRYVFQLHLKKHKGEKVHVCDTCGKSFYTFHLLNKHIKMTHLKLRPYLCTYCNKRFSSKCALRTHVRQHTNETPYKCEVCGEGFRQNVSLKAHRKSKHNISEAKRVECKVCGKKFSCEQAIHSHMRLH